MAATLDLSDGTRPADVLVTERPGPPEIVVEVEPPGPRSWRAVPWRTIVGAVGVVLAALAGVQLLRATHQVLLLLLVAGFLAVILNPLVDAVQRRISSRVLATAIVFTAGGLVIAGLVALFVGPLAPRFQSFLHDLPGFRRRLIRRRSGCSSWASRSSLRSMWTSATGAGGFAWTSRRVMVVSRPVPAVPGILGA